MKDEKSRDRRRNVSKGGQLSEEEEKDEEEEG